MIACLAQASTRIDPVTLVEAAGGAPIPLTITMGKPSRLTALTGLTNCVVVLRYNEHRPMMLDSRNPPGQQNTRVLGRVRSQFAEHKSLTQSQHCNRHAHHRKLATLQAFGFRSRWSTKVWKSSQTWHEDWAEPMKQLQRRTIQYKEVAGMTVCAMQCSSRTWE